MAKILEDTLSVRGSLNTVPTGTLITLCRALFPWQLFEWPPSPFIAFIIVGKRERSLTSGSTENIISKITKHLCKT